MAFRRGQAALEFLSTYGFAFLIILVMVGALTYFGVLSPGNLLPQRCLIGSEFECKEFILDLQPGGSVNMNISVIPRTGTAINMVLTNSQARSEGYGQSPLGGCLAVPSTGPYAPGSRITVNCNLTQGPGGVGAPTFPPAGEKVKVAYDFSYTLVGGTYPQPVRGEVLGALQ